MTPEQLEAQSREAIKAWCDDPSVQLEYSLKDDIDWKDKSSNHDDFYVNQYYYRIAKPKKWYRVCLDKRGELVMACNETHEKLYETTLWFDRWLDERKYYD